MALLNILKYPDNRLKLMAQAVETFDDNLKQIVKDMFETMYQGHGVGLAAIQVNIQQRILVMDTSPEQNSPICLINPKIIHEEGKAISEEGCLSFPGVYAKVKRAKQITTQYVDEHGKAHERTSTELESNCIQHEIDHLNGVVFVDHLSKLKRNLIIKKLDKLQRTTY
jgi:peptide deformylase